jgi:DNA-binding transcriptional MerR regulator
MKISDLAHLARVSTRTLRHYDEIGLFKPARIDSVTGYRTYSVNQMALLNRILALRDLGFALEQITTLTANGFAPERLKDLLELRKAELETHILEQKNRLEQVELRLERIKKEGYMFDYTVNIKSISDCLVASVGNPDLDLVENNIRSLRNYYSVLFAHLAQHGVQSALPQINIAHPTQDDFWKMEVAQMLEKPMPETTWSKYMNSRACQWLHFSSFAVSMTGTKLKMPCLVYSLGSKKTVTALLGRCVKCISRCPKVTPRVCPV